MLVSTPTRSSRLDKRIGFESCPTTRRGKCSTTRRRSCSTSKILPTNPIPNPIRDRSGRPGITHDVISVQDERKTSRSQEISVNSFNEELCSSDRSGRPGITHDVISVQECSSEDINVEQTHDRSGRPGKDTVAVQDDPKVYHEVETLIIDNETNRERIEAGHGLQNSRTTTFCCEARAKYQRSRIDSEN